MLIGSILDRTKNVNAKFIRQFDIFTISNVVPGLMYGKCINTRLRQRNVIMKNWIQYKWNVPTQPVLQSCTTSEDGPGQPTDGQSRMRVLKHRLPTYEHFQAPHCDHWASVVVAIVVAEVVVDGVDVVVCGVVVLVVVEVTEAKASKLYWNINGARYDKTCINDIQ